MQTHRATRENGPSVVGGRLVWTSATGITSADPNSYGGCPRKFWYDQVAGEKEPATKAMAAGTVLHTEVENRLRFGRSLQTPLALSGSMFIPQPGSGLEIERPIHFTTAGGIGIFGHVDLYNFRQEYIDPEGELQRDPSWSFEVKDWKTTADFQYAKTERELGENIQLVTYAEAGFRFAPDMEHSRLTHVYFRTRGTPAAKLVTIRRTREEIGARWQYSESVVRLMSDVAREPTAETVPGYRKACDAYRGCSHRARCSIYRFDALDAVYGKIASDHVGEKMGLISNNPQMMNAPQAQQTQPQVDMRAQLEAEEARQRQALAQQQQQMPQQLNTAELVVVCQRPTGYGYGFPTLAGNAAQAFAVLNAQQIAPGSTYSGIPAPSGAKRSLHGVQLTEVAHIYQLEGELAKEAAASQPAAPMMQQAPLAPQMQTAQYAQTTQNPNVVTPPSAPQYPGLAGASPAFQQQQMERYAVPVTKAMDAPGLSFLPPDAPQSMPQLAMQHVASAQTAPDPMQAPPAAEAPKKRGRPAKVQDITPGPIAASVPGAPLTSSPSAPATQVAPATTSPYGQTLQTSPIPDGLMTKAAALAMAEELARKAPARKAPAAQVTAPCVLVNARAAFPTKSLASYVDYINAELSKRYCVSADGKPSVQDVRCAPKDSPLAFGGWKGAVREVVKADPPPHGDYHLDTLLDELSEAVADALRVVAEQRGWLYVRGVRV